MLELINWRPSRMKIPFFSDRLGRFQPVNTPVRRKIANVSERPLSYQPQLSSDFVELCIAIAITRTTSNRQVADCGAFSCRFLKLSQSLILHCQVSLN